MRRHGWTDGDWTHSSRSCRASARASSRWRRARHPPSRPMKGLPNPRSTVEPRREIILFLKDLALKTHRGLRGRVEQGRSGGGRCYGYTVVPGAPDRDGVPERGLRKIETAEAVIVRRIFQDYANGRSAKAIAQTLNGEAIVGPHGGAWGPSTIAGNAARRSGILNNELYVGRLVWNRLRYIKDPSTGRRVSRLNEPQQWVVVETPELFAHFSDGASSLESSVSIGQSGRETVRCAASLGRHGAQKRLMPQGRHEYTAIMGRWPAAQSWRWPAARRCAHVSPSLAAAIASRVFGADLIV